MRSSDLDADRGSSPVDEPAARPAYPIASVDNALRLLVMFERRPTLKLAEVARELGVVRSTAHRLLAMLEHYGFVEQDGDTEAYLVGERLLDIGLATVRNNNVRRLARPWLDKLVEQTGETAHFVELRRRHVLFVDCVESPHGLRAGNRVGEHSPSHLAASGRAMLAALPIQRVRSIFPEKDLPGREEGQTMTRAELEADLEQIRSRGYEIGFPQHEADRGLITVAAAVRDPWGKLRGALVVAAPLDRTDTDHREQLITAVVHAADSLGPTVEA